jgi:hypothetical protein
MKITRPDKSEYDPRYTKYIELIQEEDLLFALKSQSEISNKLLVSIPETMIDVSYADGEWTVREIVGHILDSERIFGFRLLCFGRGDTVSLERTDQDIYVKNAKFENYRFNDLVQEFVDVRKSHISLFMNLPIEAWDRGGIVSGVRISVRAIAYLMLGHERHHLETIRMKYLQKSA